MAVIRRALDPCGRAAVWAVPAGGRPEMFVGSGCLPSRPLQTEREGQKRWWYSLGKVVHQNSKENEDD